MPRVVHSAITLAAGENQSVDEYDRSLYGHVFGMQGCLGDTILPEEEVDHILWGEPESEEEEEVVEENEEKEAEREVDQSELVTPAEGLATPSGFSSVPTGFELRKKRIESEMENNETPELYTVLPENRADGIGQAMMGSAHVDNIGAATTAQKSSGDVELSLDPSDLERLDSNSMAARYGHCENDRAIWLRKISVTWLLNTQLNERARGSDSNNRQTEIRHRSTRNSNFTRKIKRSAGRWYRFR